MNITSKGEFEMQINGCDSILDGITFDDLIVTLQSNERVIDEEAVVRVFEDIVRANLKDARYVLKNNIKFILDNAKGEEA
jgi:hypothetical protein